MEFCCSKLAPVVLALVCVSVPCLATALDFPATLSPTGEALSEPDAVALLPRGAVFYGRVSPARIAEVAERYGLLDEIPAEQKQGILDAARSLSPDGKAELENLGAVIGLRQGASIWMALGQPAARSVVAYEKHVARLKGKFLAGKVKRDLEQTPPAAQIRAYLGMAPGLFIRHTFVLPTSGAPGMAKLMEQMVSQGAGIPLGDAAAMASALEQRGASAKDAKVVARKLASSRQGKVIGVGMPNPGSMVQFIDTGKFTVAHVVHALNDTEDIKGLVAHLTANSPPAKLKWGKSGDAASILGDDMTGEVLAGQALLGKEAMTIARMNDAMDLARMLDNGDPADPQKIRKKLYDDYKKRERGCQQLFRIKPMLTDATLAIRQLDRGVRMQLGIGLGKKIVSKLESHDNQVDVAKASDGAALALFAATGQDQLERAVKLPGPLRNPQQAMQKFATCPNNQLMVTAAGLLPAIPVAAQKLAPPQQPMPTLPASIFASVFLPGNRPTRRAPRGGAAPPPPSQPPIPEVLAFAAFDSAADLSAAMGMLMAASGMPLTPTNEMLEVGQQTLQVNTAGPAELGVQIASGGKPPWLFASAGGGALATLAGATGSPRPSSPFWLLADFPKLKTLVELYETPGSQPPPEVGAAGKQFLEHFTRLAVEGRASGAAVVLEATMWK